MPFGISETVIRWDKVTKSYSDFSAASLSNDIEIYLLPEGSVIHGVVIKHSTSFSGGLIASYTISVGIIGNLSKYAPSFSVSQAVSDTAFQATSCFYLENWGSSKSVRANAVSLIGLLNADTQGEVEFYIGVSQPKQ